MNYKSETAGTRRKKDGFAALKALSYTAKTVKYAILVFFTVIILFPLLWVLMSSLKTQADITAHPFSVTEGFQWVNYSDAWLTANMSSYFLNSVIMTLGSLALLLVFTLPCSYCLARFKYKWLKIVFYFFLGGLFINVNYIVIPLLIMLNRLGGRALTDNRVTVMFIYAATNFAFTVFLQTTYMRGLPRDYEEAAKIDGAGHWKTFFLIILPLCAPSVLTVIMFNFMGFWNEYIVSMTFFSRNRWTLPAGVQMLAQNMHLAANIGRQYAGLMIVIVPILIVYAFIQGKLTKGVTIGGIKD